MNGTSCEASSWLLFSKFLSCYRDNKRPFLQSELLKPEEVMIYDSCIKEEPMECEVDDE